MCTMFHFSQPITRLSTYFLRADTEGAWRSISLSLHKTHCTIINVSTDETKRACSTSPFVIHRPHFPRIHLRIMVLRPSSFPFSSYYPARRGPWDAEANLTGELRCLALLSPKPRRAASRRSPLSLTRRWLTRAGQSRVRLCMNIASTSPASRW